MMQQSQSQSPPSQTQPSSTTQYYSHTSPPPPTSFHPLLSLASRRRPQVVHGVKPVERYNPSAVLNERAHSARTNAPLSFKRKVQRHDPFDPPPMEKWKNEHMEQSWNSIATYPAVHNEKVYKSKQILFSKPAPMFNAPPAAELPYIKKGAPAPDATQQAVSFRPAPADPLLAYLEQSWQNPDLNRSVQNTELTRSSRRFFDSETTTMASSAPHFDQAQLDAQLLLEEGQRAKADRDRKKKGQQPASARSNKKQNKRGSKNRPDVLLSELDAVTFAAEKRREKALNSRNNSPSRTQRAAQLAILDPIASLQSQPTNFSTGYHPNNRFFRSPAPNLSKRELVAALKLERDWNDRHHLASSIEGWY